MASAETHACPRGDEVPNGPYRDMALNATWREDGTCSYCGSLSEAAFFAAIEAGAEIGPTDKSYKAYVTGGGHNHAKFYYQHLSAEGRGKFIDLYNAKGMKIGDPGHFYVRPFFCRPVPVDG